MCTFLYTLPSPIFPYPNMDTQISEANPLGTGQLLPKVMAPGSPPRGSWPLLQVALTALEKLWLQGGMLVSARCQVSLEAFLLLVQASRSGHNPDHQRQPQWSVPEPAALIRCSLLWDRWSSPMVSTAASFSGVAGWPKLPSTAGKPQPAALFPL